MTQPLCRIVILAMHPLLTPMYIVAAMLFAGSTLLTGMPLHYRLSALSTLSIPLLLMPATLNVALRLRLKTPRRASVDPLYAKWLYLAYAATMSAAASLLGAEHAFSPVTPLVGGLAAAWIAASISTALRRTYCHVLLCGACTAFASVLALSVGGIWIGALYTFLIASGIVSTALVHFRHRTLPATGIDFAIGMAAMLLAIQTI